MKATKLILAGLLALAPLSGVCATATAEFENPEEFTDFSVSGMTEQKSLKVFQDELEPALERIAEKYLSDGETLVITFTDIDMAGDIQPWRNRNNADIRYIEAIYPPRLKFTYVLTDADGNVVKEGDTSESDLAFQMNVAANVRGQHMSFFYELELLNDWARKELGRRDSDSGND